MLEGGFNTLLWPMARSSRQKLNKEMLELTNIISQMNLTDSYRTILPKHKRIYLLLSTSWNFLQNWPHPQTQNKFQQQIQENWSNSIITDYHRVNLDINNNRNKRKPTNSWKLNNSLLNEKWVRTEIKKKIKDFPELKESECTTYPNLWDTLKTVPSTKCLH